MAQLREIWDKKRVKDLLLIDNNSLYYSSLARLLTLLTLEIIQFCYYST